MSGRLCRGKRGTTRARSRFQRTVSVFLIASVLCACIPMMAHTAGQADRGTVRLTVAHQHFGSWCVGYLYVNAREVWYEVGGPERYKNHAFRIERSQIIARQWVVMGQPQNVAELKFERSIYHFWLLGNQDLASTPAALPQQVALPYQICLR